MSTSSSGLDTQGNDYIGVILHTKHEYAIISSDLSFNFRDILNEIDKYNLV